MLEEEIWIDMRNGFLFLIATGMLAATCVAQEQTAQAPAGQVQAAPGKLAFEVASIRPSAPLDMAKLAAQVQAGKMPRFGARVEASRADYTYMSLKDLVAEAYKVKAYQVTGPAWLGSERFD